MDVVQTCSAVIRRQLQSGFEQQFRLIQHLALVPDSGQQPQGLDMVGVEQIRPEDLLRRGKLAIREQASGPHDLGR